MVVIAIIPSNQDKNHGSVGNYVEGKGMHELANELSAEFDERHISHAIFSADKYGWESKDRYNCEGLLKQTKAAATWLEKNGNSPKLAIHLHSDSGNYAHTLGIYDGRTSYPLHQESFQLAKMLADECMYQHPHGCATDQWDYGTQGYIFASSGSPTAVNVLIETFSHSHAPSCEWFVHQDGMLDVAAAMAHKIGEIYSNMLYFPETKHSVGGAFKSYYEAAGSKGLEYFGYPITEEMDEVLTSDAKTHTVQYFQRSIYEFWPDDIYQPVKLRLLGQMAYEHVAVKELLQTSTKK